jgi:hypothetical protein
MTTYLANAILGELLGAVPFTKPAVLYIGIATSVSAGGTVTGEPTIGSYGYYRVPIANPVSSTSVAVTSTNNSTSIGITGGTTTYPVGTVMVLSGTVPSGFSASTPYYVTGGSSSTVTLAASPGGAAITATSTVSSGCYLASVFGTAASAQIANGVALSYGQDTSTNWGTISMFFIADAATGGNVWFYNTATGNTTIVTGNTPYYASGGLIIGPMA